MTHLFIVRHGETAWSRTGQHTSTTDLPLTEKGREQAKAITGVLDRDQFGTVYESFAKGSSPDSRNLATTTDSGSHFDPIQSPNPCQVFPRPLDSADNWKIQQSL